MDFSSSLIDKIGLLAPEWDPEPVLQQLRAPQNIPDPRAGAGGAEGWNFLGMGQANTPMPGDPSKFQGGPMAGTAMNTPAAAPGAAPLSPQQLAALHGIMPQTPLAHPHPGAVAAWRGQGNLQMHQLTLPTQPERKKKPGFADIFGRG